MDYDTVLAQVLALLQQEQRLSYRVLKRRLHLDDDLLEDLKEDLIYAKKLAVDEDGRVLVWTGGTSSAPPTASPVPLPATPDVSPAQGEAAPIAPPTPEAERRQLTVLFCDLVDSTQLSGQLDPEDLREVVRAYQETCAKVIARFDGHIAQYLGDGLLVYFGYPLAHEDDAQRAVRAGLGMVEALGQLNICLKQDRGVDLAVRLGIHTGLVVVGEVGGGTRQEQLALGETPNLAARLQGIAALNTVVISATTFQLLGGFFACQSLGTSLLKGFAQPLEVYQVLSESTARSRLDVAGSTGLTPLVGREQEVGLLRERWAQAKDGLGQVVLLSGEAGIGKSRLVQVLKEHVAAPQAWLIPCQCSPYYQNTALYPLIDVLERVVLRFERDESPQHRLSKLEGFLVQYGLQLAEAVPLFASLLSLPLTAEYGPLSVSPEQQKQRTLHAFLTIFLRVAARQPLLFVMEDLHWVDPSTLELLSLLVDQGPTARILVLLTCRPDFSPPWTGRSHLTQVTLPRLPRRQAAEITGQVAHSKTLPPEVVEQVVAKTDGVPLFVEELTKMVLESGLLQEREDRYELTGPLPPLAIPATLHDSLMARLDRLATVKGLAQLGTTLGREFSYELLQAVSPWDEGTLRRGLHQLVEAEFLYQQGLPPLATYRFKHALIQDTAYQSLLRSTRQQHHRHIAQVLEAQFPEICETQPELLAHHHTEAGLVTQAIPYWQQAGRRAIQRSANLEAIQHLTKGLALLATLPETPVRAQQELDLQLALGLALIASVGRGSVEVQQVYRRAEELCQQVGDTPQRFQALWGLFYFYLLRAEILRARDLGEQLRSLALRWQDRAFELQACWALGTASWFLGELVAARTHLEAGLRLYDPQQHHGHAVLYSGDPGVACGGYRAFALWALGYADQALHQSQQALALARQVAHPYTLALALNFAAWLHQFRREAQDARAAAEAAIALADEQGFPNWFAMAKSIQGWAVAAQGQQAEGLTQMRQGLAAWQATESEVWRPNMLGRMTEACAETGQVDEALGLVIEALKLVQQNGERLWEAELYRLRGELLLRQDTAAVRTRGWSLQATEAEACFQRALDVARRQQAKSLELRAAMSLARLWQHQDKRTEAYDLLAPVYGWFTEGFDTADLQDAKALLEELA
jgi:class 3 adenylate cyclase/predicted ATPase